ncbi:hypothetical protein TUM20985_40300 [Mycobacterium antarcticum]|nr:hypothetical protein TUM20985_40300 [Mycolicibacterium sp. TUM20985]GLP73572.1 hypothetical protein TUM20983_06820 [Mycolicibacterium sp. TUM20983]GLP82906.1 hypothetical protein TUM20984_43260 [Mycolicibacterium sp. TUM20984]
MSPHWSTLTKTSTGAVGQVAVAALPEGVATAVVLLLAVSVELLEQADKTSGTAITRAATRWGLPSGGRNMMGTIIVNVKSRDTGPSSCTRLALQEPMGPGVEKGHR